MGLALTESPPVGPLIDYVLVTMTLVAIVGALLYLPELAGLLQRLAHASGYTQRRSGARLSSRPAPTTPPPVEQLARHARRLRAELLALDPGTSVVRQRGFLMAYDDLLVAACKAFDVPDTLSGLDPGTDKDAERRRVEHNLEAAGLRLTA